jgi:hypothetical protein
MGKEERWLIASNTYRVRRVPCISASSGPAIVDALEHHLSANAWALAAVTVVLIGYAIARIVTPAILHAIVPDVVRTVLNLI